jgi:hypothetical protein
VTWLGEAKMDCEVRDDVDCMKRRVFRMTEVCYDASFSFYDEDSTTKSIFSVS